MAERPDKAEPINGFTGFAKRDSENRQSRLNGTTGQLSPVVASAAARQGMGDVPSPVRRPAAASATLDSLSAAERRGAYVRVDTGAIGHNVQVARRLVRHGTHVMAVLNADAFGHGIVKVAKAALAAGADHLGVATVEEGIELRDAQVNAPILVLSQPPSGTIPLLLARKITPAIFDSEFAIRYGESADGLGVEAPYHLALNTGMNRIGVQAADAVEFVRSVRFHRALELEGIFTHFATAEMRETSDVHIQFRRFVAAASALHDAGVDTGIVHCANTAATVRFPETCLHMVRWGTGLYGLNPCAETRSLGLRPAMEVRARITDVRWPQMSEGVSFGMQYRSAGNSVICTLPIGFADGLPQALAGRIDVLYNGMRCRQVGEICMDQCMFEVDMRTSADRARANPRPGDEVTVVGSQGNQLIALSDLAGAAHMSQTALACAFGARLPREYDR